MGSLDASPEQPVVTPQAWWEVAAALPDAGALVQPLLPHPGVLQLHELATLASDICARTDIWQPLVVVDGERRRYRLLYEDDRTDIWVLSWMAGQGTGFHDHDGSSVGLACAAGTVLERQMVLPTGASTVRMEAGMVRTGGPGYIHSVAHDMGSPAVTVHAYSPRLERVGQYRVDDDGILHRSIEHGRQELIDHTIAAIDPERG